MLRFILGTTGAAKTKYLYDVMCQLAKNGDEKLIFLVPDQYSFNTEKAFLEMLGPKLSRNIKVFGFSRLCDYVFEVTGNRFLSFADEGVRNVVMDVAIEQVRDNLELFSKRASSTDLTTLMLNSIKEYKKCSITSAILYDVAHKVGDSTLSKKLSETALLYDTYDAILQKSYVDPLDSVTKVSEILSTKELFKDYTIAVDSYYGFTAQEYEVLSKLLVQSKDMYVALTTDSLDCSNGDLFFVSERTKKRLTRIAKTNDVKIVPHITLTENTRFVSEDIKCVEQNLFRLSKEQCDFHDDGLVVYEAGNIYDEADFVARNIRKLIVEEGYEFSDIAIITRHSDKYVGILDNALEKYDISYFMDKPQDIDTKPLIKFVMSCFDVINNGFDKDDVLSVLKTALTDISVEDIADFENYLFTWDISGKAFFNEFTLSPQGFADDMSDSDKNLLSKIEHTRATVIDALRTFYFDTKDATALEISKALMKLVYKLHVKENLQKLCDVLESEMELELCSEQVRLYNTFVAILDKMVSVIGDYRVSAKRFSELLHINFANTDISFIPRGLDQVDVACADRSLVNDKKAVFIVGAIDGEFPNTPVEAGVFSDDERNLLSTFGLTMSDSVEQLVPTEKYLAYKAMCCASHKLFVSYYTYSLGGEKRTASELVTELPSILSNIRRYHSVDCTVFDSMWSERSAFDYLVKRYNHKDPDIIRLREYFSGIEKYASVLDCIERSQKSEPHRITDKELAQKLFNTNMILSASQVESFHLCKFEYFCKYGLSVRERRQAKIDSLEYGTLMHYLFEEFLKKHKDDDFSQITVETIKKEVSQLLDAYVLKHLGGKEGKSKRFLYLFYRVNKTAVRIIERLVQEFAQSKFRPSDFELTVGEDIPSYTLKVTDEINVTIRGKVDRVDVMESNGKKYIRIVDYKTGTKKYNLSDVLYGLNLQMLIYMSAVNCGGEKYYNSKISPAGVLYVPAVSPSVNVTLKGLDSAIADAEKDKKMHGIILDDKEVITGMERDVNGVYIPVSLKGDTIVDKSGTLASLEQFGALFSQVDKAVGEMATLLCSGDIGAVPAKGIYDACLWCPYSSVCSYKDGDSCRDIEKMSKDEVYSTLMRKEEQSDEA